MPVGLRKKDNRDLMDRDDWYDNAQSYWTSVEPTVNGMLGGFASVDPIDVKGSLDFIDEFVHGVKGVNNIMIKQPTLKNNYACDMGAGVGRVTKNFLLKVPFDKVDLVEQAPNFVQEAKDHYLVKEIEQGQVGDITCQGLQHFNPTEKKYDLIWCQWVLGHLTDDHLVAFFKRCIKGLAPGGLIGVKENNATADYIVDEEDSSVTRPNESLKQLFAKSGLTLIKEQVQQGLPVGLFTVRMYMLKPSDQV